MKQTLLIIFTLCIGFTWIQNSHAQTNPQEVVKTANENIQNLLKQNIAENTPQATKRDAELKTLVTNLLDLDYMAQKALGRYWRQQSEEERQEYLGLMRQLVERSYLRQARSRTEYEVQFRNVTTEGDESEVETNLRIKTRNRIENVEIIYTMKKQGQTWRVVDIETDGASTVMNYRTQFRRIIKQHGFGELISRMRKRLDAGEADL